MLNKHGIVMQMNAMTSEILTQSFSVLPLFLQMSFFFRRPTMIKYGISNIRDLIGHKVDLEMVQKNPICRLE